MLKIIVPIILVICYFYIAIWVFENISEIVGIVLSIGIVGVIIEIIFDYLERKKKKKEEKND